MSHTHRGRVRDTVLPDKPSDVRRAFGYDGDLIACRDHAHTYTQPRASENQRGLYIQQHECPNDKPRCPVWRALCVLMS